MKCLVLGGGGFIGSHVCESLLAAGHDVIVFEKEGRSRENLLDIENDIQWFEGDFSNPQNLKKALQGVEIVIHLISTTLPKSSNDSPVYDLSSNVIPTLQLLEEACKIGVKKIIFISSGGTVYGVPQTTPITEEHSTKPICAYGIHKLTIEKYLFLFNHLYGMDYTILRVGNPYGERQKPTGAQGVVTVMLYKALKDMSLEIWGDGSVVRDYLHVSDLARAILLSIDSQVPNRIVNIGSGIGISVNEIIKRISQELGRVLDVKYVKARELDVPVNILDISMAEKYLDWSPTVDVQLGISKTAEYLRRVISQESLLSEESGAK